MTSDAPAVALATMTLHEAFAHAIDETRAMTYDHPYLEAIRRRFAPDTWQTPTETRTTRKGLCRDFAIAACARTWELAGAITAPAEVVVVIGHVDEDAKNNGDWHAWAELVDEHEELTWGEATPGYRGRLGAPADAFPKRIPRFAQLFNGEVLGQEFEYGRAA